MAEQVWTVKRMLDWTVGYLERKGDERPRLSAEWLISAVTGLSRVELYMSFDRQLDAAELARMHVAVERRGKGEPLQYVTGEMPFRHIVVRCEEGVLIPRPETEVLVDAALEGVDAAVAAGQVFDDAERRAAAREAAEAAAAASAQARAAQSEAARVQGPVRDVEEAPARPALSQMSARARAEAASDDDEGLLAADAGGALGAELGVPAASAAGAAAAGLSRAAAVAVQAGVLARSSQEAVGAVAGGAAQAFPAAGAGGSLREAASAASVSQARETGEPAPHIAGPEDSLREAALQAMAADGLLPDPADQAKETATARVPLPAGARVLDLCTGTGCIALSLAGERPGTFVVATDISPQAVSLALRNRDALGLADAVEVVACDLAAGVPADLMGSFSVLVSNPPYIPSAVVPVLPSEVADFEPRLALDGGPDGLDVFRRILELAPRALAPGGWLCVELFEESLEAAAELVRAQGGWSRVEVREDLTHRPRVLVAMREGAPMSKA